METRVGKIIGIIEKEYPGARTELKHGTPFQMLVATILSAQTTDAMVNRITPELFKKYPGPEEFAAAQVEEIQGSIKSVNFYRNKGKNIKNLSLVLLRDFNGEVPGSLDKLVSLPGVARKTANVVLAEAFGKAEGIVVDTHVKRLSLRLGLTEKKVPEKIEKDLIRIIPKEKWISFSMGLILHGRKTCKAHKPLCIDCKLASLCPYEGKTEEKPETSKQGKRGKA